MAADCCFFLKLQRPGSLVNLATPASMATPAILAKSTVKGVKDKVPGNDLDRRWRGGDSKGQEAA